MAAHNPSNTDPAMVSGGPSSITSSGQFPSGITEGRPPTPGISEPPESSPSWEKPRANDVIGIASELLPYNLFVRDTNQGDQSQSG